MIEKDEEFTCIHLEDDLCPYHMGCIALGYVSDCDCFKHENQIIGGFII